MLIEWTAGLLGAAAWTQSWDVVKRGHFRIVAWSAILVVALAALAARSEGSAALRALMIALIAGSVAYLLVQYVRTEVAGTVVGYGAAILGAALLAAGAQEMAGWPQALAAVELASGALLLGAVTNGLLLGHWYLNQPGLKPWALARLTNLALAAVAACGLLGLVGAGRLLRASTQGAAFGLPGFGDSFAPAFFAIWVGLLGFTAVVVYLARRCVQIKSIQSATGLYYVALLTAGVSEFLIRYLMVSG